MNSDQIKGAMQKVGGHVEEAAGALVGDEGLKIAGQEDQIKGDARQAWGNLKEAGEGLVDRAKVANADAEVKAARAEAFDREHAVEVHLPPPPKQEKPAENEKSANAGQKPEAEQKEKGAA